MLLSAKQELSYSEEKALINRMLAISFTSSSKGKGVIGHWIDVTARMDDPNSPSKSGSLSMHGYYKVELETEKINFIVEINSTGMTYGNCSANGGFYNTGDITFTDGAKNILMMTYKNCVASATYNGTPVSN